ncbi:alpha-L-rhamnosidase [Actinomyces succiniciruminis]|uniref:alpha-L-rhamnosidase n=1 Tax=Actinomyces succiniciruminis TaxID=1522002 RepID=A0A1L7R846_9ACTO|nr:alpha-L-rhamnosidase [Actinomyces succiniciruminis]CED89957.1 Alpha-L-rhamnosidase A [Actinomyces succiniciruminis]
MSTQTTPTPHAPQQPATAPQPPSPPAPGPLPEVSVSKPDGVLPSARPAVPEPAITAAALPDPVGELAAPTHLKFEQYLPGDVLGGAAPAPRLSWEIATAPAGWTPTDAEVELTRTDPAGIPIATPETLPLATADGVLTDWPAAPLVSRERVVVRVRVTGSVAVAASATAPSTAVPATTEWSEPVVYEAGLLDAADWEALPVGPAWPENPESDRRPPRVRHEFTVDRPVVAARAYVSAHGLIRAELDGGRVGTDELVPGWTVYGQRLVARAYDVTAQLLDSSPAGDGVGRHALGAQLADGWYRGHIGFDGGYRNLYGDDVAAIIQLELTHADGTRTTVATGPDWRAGAGEILFTGLYEGETVDARLLTPGWSAPGFDDAEWSPVAVGASDAEQLIMPLDAPVRAQETLLPVAVTVQERQVMSIGEAEIETAPERVLIDFGQNLSGRLRIRVAGPAGTTITLRHAEVLEDGRLGTRPLRGAAATDRFTLAGDGVEEWEPAFTIHGFRYADVAGWPGGAAAAKRDIEAGAITAVVVHTSMERLGAFDCSDARVNRLHENSRWSMRDNFVALPTDCPQRDERLGWTGDIQAFAPTAAFHYGCTGLLSSWLADLALEQAAHGTVTWYVPVIPGGLWTPPRPAAVWGDAATVVPWELFRATGDRGLLAQQYDSAKAWVDLVDSLSADDHVWDSGMQLGDWLDPSAPPDNPMQAMTDPYLVATAFFAQSARIVARWAAVLGKNDDAARYTALAEAIGEGFRARFTDGAGHMTSDTQTAYALAITFDLTGSEEHRQVAGDRLAELVEASGGHVSTGFAGTPVLTGALTATGHADAAYRLLLTTSCPSWLYTVTMGATTTWERWDSMLPDGTINPGDMTSFNHYALGAVAAWLQRSVAGLAPAEPGYRVIEVAPAPGGGLTHAESMHRTPYGWAVSSWRLVDESGREVTPQAAAAGQGRLELDVVVPVGARARVTLPGREGEPPLELSHGRHHLVA